MAHEELTASLGRTPLLAGLPPSLLEEVAQLCSARTLAKGERVFAAGDAAAFLPFLLDGVLKLFRTTADGREHVIHLVRAPASFAEAAVFGPAVFPADAQAVTDGLLATLPRAALLDLLRRRPEVTLALLASMSSWMRRLADLVESLSLRTVEERVAAYLLAAFERSGVALRPGAQIGLPDAKHLIAALCATAPEVLSRTFRRLDQDGVVSVDGPSATLRDPAALRRLARAEG